MLKGPVIRYAGLSCVFMVGAVAGWLAARYPSNVPRGYVEYVPIVRIYERGGCTFSKAESVATQKHLAVLASELVTYDVPFCYLNDKLFITEGLANDLDTLANFTEKASNGE
jgi:hypothetical protein